MTTPALFPELLRARASHPELGSRIAIAAGGESLTYRDLMHAVDQRAMQYCACGIGKGSRIAFLFDRTPQLVVSMLGALISGISFTVLSRREAESEIVEKLRRFGFSALVVSNNHREQGTRMAQAASLRLLTRDDITASADKDIELPQITADDEAIIIFTSGSSGTPKAVRIGHGNIASNTAGLCAMTPLGINDHLLHIMPLSHTNGILNQLIAPLSQGARVTLLARFEAQDFISQMVDLRPTIITGVPTIYQRLLPLEIPARATERLRMARCGSAPLAAETQKAIEMHLGVEVIVSYGQTETTCTSTSNLPGARRIGSVGRALPGQEVAILALDSDRILSQGQTGEVAIRGANIALGYVGAETFNSNSWLRTGDSGHFDNDGYLFLTGRLKEIIIRGGENLSPVQIENVLLMQDGICAACVCGAPDTDLGEVPVAFVEVRGAQSPDLAALNGAIADRLSPAHRLRDIFVLDKLPTNNVGKIDRKFLEKDATSRLASLQPTR
ncbi:MAG TPA: class I adenylate-forming enzyme family protein [Hyphomicrobiaceae bacterium]|nr:class I adenylate-forming enzyme family protein [Hyphomicrobiaceae bacterium]